MSCLLCHDPASTSHLCQDNQASMEYSRLPVLPIPASIRRRLPRFSSAQKGSADNRLSGASAYGLSSSSEPHLAFHGQFSETVTIETRPSTASDDLDSSDSSSRGSDSPRPGGIASPVQYETESGLRWNRVVPAFNLLRNAGYEAQQPQADGRLSRSLYVSALMYLLDALPPDLTPEETTMLQHRLPESVKSSIPAATQPGFARLEGPIQLKSSTPSKSYLHRLLASTIVQIFLIVQFLLPYLRVFLRQVYEYERAHRIMERIVTATLDVADGLGNRGLDIGTSVSRFNESRVGSAVGNLAAWWAEGIAGGIYDGVGEGMAHLGLIKPGLEIDRGAIQVDRR